VIVADVPDRPGGLSDVLEVFASQNINVEYTYAIAHSLIAFGTDDRARAEDGLSQRGIRLLSDADLVKL